MTLFGLRHFFEMVARCIVLLGFRHPAVERDAVHFDEIILPITLNVCIAYILSIFHFARIPIPSTSLAANLKAFQGWPIITAKRSKRKLL